MSLKEKKLFNIIAPVYALFFNMQKRMYANAVKMISTDFDIYQYNNIIDIGCGTGAFCSVLAEKGLKVTGVDAAEKMIQVAKKKTQGEAIDFKKGNVIDGLPMPDNSYDIAFASYVAHGLKRDDRKKLYSEMSRIARYKVVIHDYNEKRSFITSVVEWLEGGEYFHFIKNAELEMKECLADMKSCFSEVNKIDISKKAAWYICTPSK